MPNQPGVREVDVAAAAAAVAAGAPLIDVRQAEEWEEVRATGAVLIPLGELEDRLTEVPEGTTLYLICRSGARSMRAAEFLAGQGRDAVNVAGGTLAWVEAALPTEQG